MFDNLKFTHNNHHQAQKIRRKERENDHTNTKKVNTDRQRSNIVLPLATWRSYLLLDNCRKHNDSRYDGNIIIASSCETGIMQCDTKHKKNNGTNRSNDDHMFSLQGRRGGIRCGIITRTAVRQIETRRTTQTIRCVRSVTCHTVFMTKHRSSSDGITHHC